MRRGGRCAGHEPSSEEPSAATRGRARRGSLHRRGLHGVRGIWPAGAGGELQGGIRDVRPVQ